MLTSNILILSFRFKIISLISLLKVSIVKYPWFILYTYDPLGHVRYNLTKTDLEKQYFGAYVEKLANNAVV